MGRKDRAATYESICERPREGQLRADLSHAMHNGPGNPQVRNACSFMCGTNSDNVLRGGLTVKHVDVPELLRVARFAPENVAVLNPPADANGERHYPTPAPEFALSSVALDRLPRDTELFSATVDSPDILLFVHGDAVVTDAQGRSLDCRGGEALFVPATVASYRARGNGLLFRARVSEPER